MRSIIKSRMLAVVAAVLVLAAGGVVAGAQNPPQQVITGTAHVTNAANLSIGEQNVRLWGVGAPVKRARCDGERMDRAARDALRELVRDEVVECRVRRVDSHGRAIATCGTRGMFGTRDLAQAMAQRGWVRDWPRQSCGAYAEEEAQARSRHRGLWAHESCPGLWGRRNYAADRCRRD